MPTIDVDDFAQEIECVFEGERYSVRDNGAVYRHQPIGKRARSVDNQWTFGKENSTNPYLHISGVRIHRIVATAFHGKPPDPKYVVDHIDSNCRNNRPENLRWLTRLENALKNPATRKKIEYLCGSIENFLKNPSMLNSLQREPNFAWMRAVTPEEAQNCLTRMSIWANTKSTPPKPGHKLISSKNFTERIYSPLKKWEVFGREPGLDLSLTPWCAQYMWGNDRHFPSCPKAFGDSPLDEYFQNLNTGAVLSCGEDAAESTQLKVVQAVILRDKAAILILCEGKDQGFSIVAVVLDAKSRHFIHMLLGSYSTRSDADADFANKKELTDFESAAYTFAYKGPMHFEFPEDRTYFEGLLCRPGETIHRYHELFDSRPAITKRREFNQKRAALVEVLIAESGRRCLLAYPELCDIGSGISVDHIIPLSSNKLNKELRNLAPKSGRKVAPQSFGSNHIKNLIVACSNCNGHKKHRFLEASRLQKLLALRYSTSGRAF